MKSREKLMKVLIAGGGTAGHINPGISIAKHIVQKNSDAEILFAGTEKGLEKKLVPLEGFKLELISVKGFKRSLSLENLITVKELMKGLYQAVRIIRSFNPDIVIGTGGYVCGPVVMMASMMKKSTLIHEQNVFPGLTNRILSRFVDRIAISFKDSVKYFKSKEKLVLTGNPVRPEMLNSDKQSARRKLAMPQDMPLVVIVGGSRGAGKINDSTVEMLLGEYRNEDCRIIFATGEAQYEKVAGQLNAKELPSVEVVPYIYNASEVYSAADLVVCRAGAITVSELQVMGIPSIIIPSPNVTANHQEYNARALERDGGAVVILDKDLNGVLLYHQMRDLLEDREQLCRMSKNAKKVGITNATEKIYSIIQELISLR